MKSAIFSVIMLLLLSGCGQEKQLEQTETAPPSTEQVIENERKEPIEGLRIELQHEAYDPSLTEYTYIIWNDSEQTVRFGEAYGLEKENGSDWESLEMKKDADVIGIGYELEPGESQALTCSFAQFSEVPEVGCYRLVKEIEGRLLYAEFELGNSEYTAETPYGFDDMEMLPENYDASAGAADGAVTFTARGVKNGESILRFLEEVAQGIPTQLRTVQEYSEGTPMVIDAIYEQGRFRWRVRSGGAVYDQYLSYVVTDGKDVFLSNGADWKTAEKYLGQELVHLIPEGTAGMEAAAALAAEIMEETLNANSARYKTWSADGVRSAALTETAGELLIGEPGRGESFRLDDDQGRPEEIKALEWQEDGVLMVYCADGARIFDPVSWKLS